MKIVQIIFSPTGGTQKAADLVSSAFGLPVETVDLCRPGAPGTEIQPEDLALLALPSYGGRVPALAAERLAALRGNGAACVLLCVYGNRAFEDTLVEMQDLAAACGLQPLAAIAAVAEHSILHQYATGRPDASDAEALRGFASRILEKKRAGGTPLGPDALPGNRPYRKPAGAGLVPKAGKGCTACGACADACPAQAIDPHAVASADAAKCISCMRCVVRCPQSARHANKAMVTAAGLALKKACSVRKECELFL